MKSIRNALLRLILLASLTLAVFANAADETAAIETQPFSYRLAPLPTSIAPYAATWSAAPTKGGTGVRYLLVDRQISLLDATPRHYTRIVMQPLDVQAVQAAAQLYVIFNPDYQKFELHAVRVTRNGKTVDRTAQVKFELLQRETKLEQQLYDGEVSAVAILSDIRVNDIIEFERSVIGENPIFQGRFAVLAPMLGPAVAETYRLRLVHPDNRKFTLRAPAFARETTESADGQVVRSVLARNVKAFSDDQDRPAWFDPQSWVEISEYQDWKEVSRWAGELFKVNGVLAPGLARRVQEWQAAGLPPERLVADVLRWVQREIRYVGIELGVNSHLPTHPHLTYERRFGDCKDKSLLLVTLLGELGIDARPALVSAEGRRSLAVALPGPHRFDHVIVRARVDGRVYWLDPTLPPQFGSLADLGANDYGNALVIGMDQDALTAVGWPSGYANTYDVRDRFEIASFSQPADLVSELTLGQAGADRYRALRANIPKEEFDRIFHADYLRMFPTAEVVGELEVRDDQERNRLTVIRRYRIPELFGYEEGRFKFSVISPLALDILRQPEVQRRTTPFSLPYPLEARISQVISLPDNPIRDIPAPSTERTPYFNIRHSFKRDDKELRRDMQISVLKDHVPAEAMSGYVEEVQKLRSKSGLSMSVRVGQASEADRKAIRSALERFRRFDKSGSGVIKNQINAEVGRYQSTLDIDSGKLSKRHLARAYANRAINLSELDDSAAGLRDIEKAIELDGSQAEYRIAKARILSYSGRFAESLAVFEQLVNEGQSHVMQEIDLGAMGTNLLYLGRHAEAERIFGQAFDASASAGTLIYSFWQHITAGRSGGRIMSGLESRMQAHEGREWPYPVGQMFLGRLSPRELLDAAKHEDNGIERDQLAEANFYIGQKFLLEGDKAKAADYFDACLELNVTPYLEHHYSRIELKDLGERPKGFMKWLKNL